MKRTQLFLVILLSLVVVQYVSSDSFAAIPVVEDGDMLAFGYTLKADAEIVETYTEEIPHRIFIRVGTFTPPGLYNALIGMALGSNKDVVVPPEEGFLPTDPDHAD
ncbi:MAG: FKBP-type peptidyl-prolyl cis-trans isomerase, partial [Candidatus Heimdallarchaeota archaeon]|nr:FKBP-type peptidyl-prolyl cis-trans isomerase [Candidatus Heimdallarchaeota archaeon]